MFKLSIHLSDHTRLALLASDRLTLSDHTLLARLIPRSRYSHFFKLLNVSEIQCLKNPLINVFYILKLSINLSDHMDYCPTNFTVMLLIFLQSSNCQRHTMFEESCYKHISHVKIHLSDHIDCCTTCAQSSYSTCSTNSTLTLLTFLQSF